MSQERTDRDDGPPAELPVDGERFFSAGSELGKLEPPAPGGKSALEQLGPSPFPKSGFPFLGFLATVYDHVAQTLAASADPKSE